MYAYIHICMHTYIYAYMQLLGMIEPLMDFSSSSLAQVCVKHKFLHKRVHSASYSTRQFLSAIWCMYLRMHEYIYIQTLSKRQLAWFEACVYTCIHDTYVHTYIHTYSLHPPSTRPFCVIWLFLCPLPLQTSRCRYVYMHACMHVCMYVCIRFLTSSTDKVIILLVGRYVCKHRNLSCQFPFVPFKALFQSVSKPPERASDFFIYNFFFLHFLGDAAKNKFTYKKSARSLDVFEVKLNAKCFIDRRYWIRNRRLGLCRSFWVDLSYRWAGASPVGITHLNSLENNLLKVRLRIRCIYVCVCFPFIDGVLSFGRSPACWNYLHPATCWVIFMEIVSLVSVYVYMCIRMYLCIPLPCHVLGGTHLNPLASILLEARLRIRHWLWERSCVCVYIYILFLLKSNSDPETDFDRRVRSDWPSIL
jgi:hypothetical protein